MWCPRCKSEYRRSVEICPICGTPLLDVPAEETPEWTAMEPEFLMHFEDPLELGQALEILRRADVPYLCKETGWGSSSHITGGKRPGGTDLYVDRRYTHRALRHLRQFDDDAQAAFTDEELDAAIDDYMTVYEPDVEEENPDKPVSPEGYRMVFVFLGIFILLVLAALIFR